MKHIKLFESINLPARNFHGLGRDLHMVTIDMASDILATWGITITEMGEIAPTCIFQDFTSITPDYWAVTIVGPKGECEALAKYWNNLTGGNEVNPLPFRLKNRKY